MDSVNANTLTEVTTVPTNKKLIFTDPDTNEGGIITMENLTKQVLQNLTSQQFALDAGNMTIPAALNALNGKSSFISKIKNANIQVVNEYVYTGLSFTVPKNTLFIFTAKAFYEKSEPLGISIVNSDSDYSKVTIIENNEKYPAILTYICGKESKDITYYIWAKYKSTGSNKIVIYGLQMK